MDDSGLTPLLIDAKKEYVGQLTDVLAPYVVNHLIGMYAAAQQQAPKTPTLAFQNALRAIPQWNSHVVQERTADIQNKYAFLGDLIAACFVAYVKILSSVKLHQQKPNIRLKLPTNDAFVHKVYIHAAREFYNAPDLLRADRATKVAVVRGAVEASVRDMLPIEDILKAYLGNTVDEDENIVPSEFVDDFGASPHAGGQASHQASEHAGSQHAPSVGGHAGSQADLLTATAGFDDDLYAGQDDEDAHDEIKHDARDAVRDEVRDDEVKHVSLGQIPPAPAAQPQPQPTPTQPRPRPMFATDEHEFA